MSEAVLVDDMLGRMRVIEGDGRHVDREGARLRAEWEREIAGIRFRNRYWTGAPHALSRWSSVRIHAAPLPVYRSVREPQVLEGTLPEYTAIDQLKGLLETGAAFAALDVWEEAVAAAEAVEFPERPTIEGLPPKPKEPSLRFVSDLGPEPVQENYRRLLGLADKVMFWGIPGKRREEMDEYLRDRIRWSEARDDREDAIAENAKKMRVYEDEMAYWRHHHAAAMEMLNTVVAEWEQARGRVEGIRQVDLDTLADLRTRYRERREPDAVAEFARFVLARSPYPAAFPRGADVAFDGVTGVLVAEIALPNLDEIAVLKPARSGMTEVSERDRKKLYADAIHATMVRTLYELTATDEIDVVRLVVVNGRLDYTDPATGHRHSDFVATVQAEPSAVLAINLPAVTPKDCFRSFRGQSAPGLDACKPSPVRPIMELSREDGRIVEGRAVMADLDPDTNLAAMPWDDFEHLIREVFEREFAASGAEVKVTRASRDWGVDAIVFDPDPIRGGKFVIQAKRYTNLVGVEAVRDLYGTVVNEGANRGILVTTSRFGPESYEFAKDKPLSLVDGPNLLEMLRRQGREYRIDIGEAKQLAKAEAAG